MKKNKFDLPSEIEKIITKFNLNENWNTDIIQDTKLFEDNKFNKESHKRVNLKELDFVTIDGEDAKDFDDAVYCEKSENNWKLFVAIADVAHYVEENSNIDKEVMYIGQGHYFQIWEPTAAIERQKKSRQRLIEKRKTLSSILTKSSE